MEQLETQNEHQRSTKLEFELRIVYVRNLTVQPTDSAACVARFYREFEVNFSSMAALARFQSWPKEYVGSTFFSTLFRWEVGQAVQKSSFTLREGEVGHKKATQAASDGMIKF